MTTLLIDGWMNTATGEVHRGDPCDVGELPDPTQTGWMPIDSPLPGHHAYVHRGRGLIALLGAGTHHGRVWLHLSVRHKQRIPTWDELSFAKDSLLGAERTGLQMLPPRSRWVDIHSHVLHVWSCVGESPVPPFDEHGSI